MNFETRIENLEARRRAREDMNAPRYLQRADRDANGHVVACERMVFPRNPPNLETLGPMLAGMLAMTREPFSRATCFYTGCEHRDTCRADGRLTNGHRVNSRNSPVRPNSAVLSYGQLATVRPNFPLRGARHHQDIRHEEHHLFLDGSKPCRSFCEWVLDTSQPPTSSSLRRDHAWGARFSGR